MSPLSRRQLLRNSFCFGLSIPFAGLSACNTANAVYQHSAQIPIFGTLVDILVYTANQSTALAATSAVEKRFQQFHHEWHAWEKGGIVSKINQAIANQQSIQLSSSVLEFIQLSQQLCRESGQLFDPGIGKLIALWGFHSEHWQGPPPSDTQIQAWLKAHPSILDLTISGQSLSSSNAQVQLDFGGNAKGLALDIAMQALKEHKVEHALVSIGGDMKSLNNKPDGSNWNVGIQSPQNPNIAIASLALHANESVVTSGTYQRYFDWQGQRYSHLLNPKTGRPVESSQSFASVTVIHADATRADAAASALLIAGKTQWQTVAKQMQINKVFCMDSQGQILQTKAMANRSKLL